MGVGEAPDLKPLGLQPLEIGQGLDAEQWAEQEFGGAKLGNSRLTERLVSSALERNRFSGTKRQSS